MNGSIGIEDFFFYKNLEPAASTTVTAAVTAAVVQDDGVRIEYKIEKLMTPLLYQVMINIIRHGFNMEYMKLS